MFINTIEFPPIKAGKESEFLEWFKWSNSIYGNFDGFLSRRLLKYAKGKSGFVTLVEHESEKTFMAMHTSKERQEAFNKLKPLLDGTLNAKFYEVVIDTV
ncbi:MAG: antibiotic biosynthesis monooxygenase [Bacteroidota bacterium]|nr:antibiotic biosynthesis monooxygenase [Bacteroidota bacterium]